MWDTIMKFLGHASDDATPSDTPSPYKNFADYSQNQPARNPDPTPTPEPSPAPAQAGGPSWFDKLFSGDEKAEAQPSPDEQVDPFQNFSNKVTGKPYR